jgi:hypothetical protein
MTTEDRLRDALHGEAARIEPRDGWNAIESRLGETAPRNRLRGVSIAAAAALVLVAAVAVIAQQDTDKPKPVITNPGTTTTTAAYAPSNPAGQRWVWPIDSTRTFSSAPDLAGDFAHEFLGVADATIGDYRGGDPHSGEIDIHSSFGGLISTLLVVQNGDGWHVFEASNPNLQIDEPKESAVITSPQRITGSSVAFEGVVHVSLYGYGGIDPKHPFLGTTTFTGHGTELTPYETSFSWEPTSATWGLLMLWTDSARDGSLAEATVRLVRLD